MKVGKANNLTETQAAKNLSHARRKRPDFCTQVVSQFPLKFHHKIISEYNWYNSFKIFLILSLDNYQTLSHKSLINVGRFKVRTGLTM